MAWHVKTAFDLGDPGVVSALDELPLWSAPFGLALLDTIRLAPDLRVLDVGCGTGFPCIEIAQRLGPGSRVWAVDPWSAALDRAREKAKRWGVANLQLLEGRAESLPFPDASFDLLVSNNGTNNVEDEDRVFAELARVARPGAQLAFTMNLPGTMREFYDVFEQVLASRGLAAERDAVQAHIHEKRKPLAFARERLERHGFQVLAADERAFAMRFATGGAMLRHSLVRVGFLGSWAALLPEREVGPVFAQVEAALDRRASDAGHLTLTVPWVCFDSRRVARPA
jgi:ubiquinone/menaquinone biosynthesis C-methylase UbiE